MGRNPYRTSRQRAPLLAVEPLDDRVLPSAGFELPPPAAADGTITVEASRIRIVAPGYDDDLTRETLTHKLSPMPDEGVLIFLDIGGAHLRVHWHNVDQAREALERSGEGREYD